MEEIARAFNPDAEWLPWLKPCSPPGPKNDCSEVVNRAHFSAPPWYVIRRTAGVPMKRGAVQVERTLKGRTRDCGKP